MAWGSKGADRLPCWRFQKCDFCGRKDEFTGEKTHSGMCGSLLWLLKNLFSKIRSSAIK
ncbi:hypothetical protein AB434_2324 [Heyndrickxia coagulans]|uniref:Uncharacterized protein n=1 Tax=Heyndrickxia coagulans TaxID=1398 RepID=A0AAN0T8Y3_HEYCO|nr:hypothetical protein SB48_HM08orf04766 [Heyndrickxia coagulans]AKN54729.1 hypothetical protein AB434_2324 [Heyndrickxia coagulans]